MIVAYPALANIRTDFPDKKIVFCDGVFDLLHAAHVEHLETLRMYGDVLVVGVMSDEFVRIKKGQNRPIMTQEERVRLVDAIRFADYTVLLYDADTHERVRTSDALKQLRPDMFVTTDASWTAKAGEFSALGIEVRIVPPTPAATGISTSKLIQRVLDVNREK